MPEDRTLIEEISAGGQLLAVIISREFREPGVNFFTPADLSQQLAYIRHPTGKVIAPHVHMPVRREVHFTQEALVLKAGRMRVDFYDAAQTYLQSRILEAGDVVLLIEGGHGFEVLEDIEMIEVKQGPYVGERDVTRFAPVSRTDSPGPSSVDE